MTRQKTGRKQVHHINSQTGLPVVGLSKQPDGRWRLIGTAIRYTELDEPKAIAKFYDLTARDESVTVNLAGKSYGLKRSELRTVKDELDKFIRANEQIFWDGVATELINRPQYAAEKTGIEKLGYLHIHLARQPTD